MVILVAVYNAEDYVRKCLESILNQTYSDYTCFVADDCSTDNTWNIITDVVGDDKRFIRIRNIEKHYPVGNHDTIMRNEDFPIDDEEICVEINGDDWLPDNGVFTRINNVYTWENVWLAHGNYIQDDGKDGFCFAPNRYNSVREQAFGLMHIRTWKAFLWKAIRVNDLKDENGQYWDVAGDTAALWAMYEMCPIEKYIFMRDINYVYNRSNPLNENKSMMDKIKRNVKAIRNQKPYEIYVR